jgi:muramoyltetrapeptide carboxypeptidase
MKTPQILQPGDGIRIVAPSRSASILPKEGIEAAKARLESLGFQVTFGKYIFEDDLQHSSSIEHRIADIHAAFADPHVKAILTVIGGFNSNELLPYLDYDLISKHPKIFCGYSDITAIATAITARCGFVTYSGPHFSSFQMEKGQDYQTSSFLAAVAQKDSYSLTSSSEWSDDAWYLDEENRNFERTEWKTYNEGTAEGTIWGGNLCTLNLLQGTPYMPELKDAILFVEDDYMVTPELFARDLTSLLQAVQSVKALVIGRFQRESKMTEEQLHFILDKHPILKRVPVLYNADFGHTQPVFTFPIGGKGTVSTRENTVYITKT